MKIQYRHAISKALLRFCHLNLRSRFPLYLPPTTALEITELRPSLFLLRFEAFHGDPCLFTIKVTNRGHLGWFAKTFANPIPPRLGEPSWTHST